MKWILNGGGIGVTVWLALIASGTWCLAVDPPPPSILKAPTELQLQYTKKIGAESEKLRSEVAKRRFGEKKQHRLEMAAGFARQLAIQREALLVAQGGGLSTSSSLATGDQNGNGYAGSTLAGRLTKVGLIALLGLTLYCSREYVIFWFDKFTVRRSESSRGDSL